MANELRFDGKVAIITGSGNGLGKSHALMFAARGAKVVINDLGGAATGGGKSSAAADAVVAEIKSKGGEAVANYDSVEDGTSIIKTAIDTFGRVDIVVNNAGILRDTTFHKMTEDDWSLIYRVHVLGAFRVTHAAWNLMREQGYGRIIFTASAAGIYGNFGQANYSMAKLGLVGLANTLALEGRKKNVHVNTIAPIAGSRLTETVLPKDLVDALKPEYVSPLVAYLCHESTQETGGLFEIGGGFVGKLRWERAAGKLFKLGRAISPEQIQGAWKDISSFDKNEHPADITASMQPILGNLQSKARGGNEFIDLDEAYGYEFDDLKSSYDERDLTTYALGVGAAQDPLDAKELQYVYEMNGDGFHAVPTFGVIPAIRSIMDLAKEGKQAPGLKYGFERILHGEQYTELKRPLPSKAKLKHKAKIKDIFDKGKNALVITEVRSYDEATGEELAYNEFTQFVRGAGGWGGERGPDTNINVPPDRAPDAVITEKTRDDQALLYRLSGDWNPLHADPTFAQAFGYTKPILHGLCTYGFAARHVIKAFSKNDPRYFKSIKARFADSVFPGETLKTEMWKESENRIVFRTIAVEREKVVISNAAVELYAEIPKPKAAAPKAAAAAAPAAAADLTPNSGDVFIAIRDHVERNPDLVGKVGHTFLFKLTGPDSQWTLDLKNGKGSVTHGAPEGGRAECQLELADSDFMDMTSGKADAQKLYFGGKLKIKGNVMASQKLEFLKALDPEKAKAAVIAHRAKSGGGAATAAPATQTAAASEGPTSGDVFIAIRDHVERHPDLVGKVGHTFLFKLTGPDSEWTLDLKNGKGGVTPGAPEGGRADCQLELADSDFMDMTSGKADAQKLYFGGKLKIKGNVMASQKLEFLKSLDPEKAKEAVLKARSAGGGAAAPAPTAASSTKAAQTPLIFEALKTRVAKDAASLVSEVAAVVQFKVTEPESTWVVDLKAAPGEVRQGTRTDANVTLTITEEDLVELAKGNATAQALFQQGKLRADGDVRVAHRLGFLKKLI